MIEINLDKIGGREFLHATPSGLRETPLPTLFFYHGFLSSKLVYSYFAVALAQAGFRVIMPDADEHGARFSGDENRRLEQFWSILQTNIDEFPELHQLALEKSWIADNKMAVAGASMGGMTALGIMARHPEVRAVACLMGSGYFSSLAQTLFPPLLAENDKVIAALAPYDIEHQLARLGNRPLLLWHGEDDDMVPVTDTQRLQQALTARQLDTQLTCILEPGVKHRITPSALSATTAFFEQNLK
ncbi:esterase [Klebsiella sp. BIGb0407]|uniref:esterase n=1 Tax=Klebsiella sp. BIGb0407 TaxID=2940603 RepID=UPI002169C720|nr:esterase [Klebsiella sp. BIGb0407]MCS3431453.1 fermentation-respiration switch protein FrsA (DUF1100 family) [Klebsiella sp. BIGb0407]